MVCTCVVVVTVREGGGDRLFRSMSLRVLHHTFIELKEWRVYPSKTPHTKDDIRSPGDVLIRGRCVSLSIELFREKLPTEVTGPGEGMVGVDHKGRGGFI